MPVERTDLPTPGRHNLPASTATLLGRDDELQALHNAMQAHRLVTIVGAGGIGKSCLALAVSRQRLDPPRDGIWWVELAGLADPTLLAMSMAQTLGISIPARGASGAALAAALAGHEALLVIDNCEHLLDAVAALVDALLKAAPGLRVLATSQVPLRLDIEQQYRLNPLAVPRDASTPHAREFGALALLVARVRAAAPNFTLVDGDLPLAIDLCQRLDGLPLAIELAAARIPLLGLRTVHDRLDERFRLLNAGARTALPRHQTLRAAMDWSYGLLDEGQRALLMQLGVFNGGFTLELAQALCSDAHADEWAVLERLAALVEKSLVVLEPGKGARYRLLESARAFALEHLAAAGRMPACLQRHAQTMLQFLTGVDDANLDGVLRTDEYAARVLPEIDNLRAAYAWSDSPGGDRTVAVGLAARVSSLIDYSLEFISWKLKQREQIAMLAIDDATAARFWRGMSASNMHGFVQTAELLEAAQRSAAMYRRLGRPKRIFSALRRAAAWALTLDDVATAEAAIDEAEHLLQPDWGPEFRIEALRSRAQFARSAGRLDEALRSYGETVHLARDVLADWRLECIEQTVQADVLWQMGRHAEAASMLGNLAAQLRVRTASDYELVDVLETWLWLLSEHGDAAAMRQVAREALPVMRRMPRFALSGCAHLLLRLGRPRDAARVLGALEARFRAGLEVHQVNLARLRTATQAALQAALPPADLATLMATGEHLHYPAVCGLLSDAVERGA